MDNSSANSTEVTNSILSDTLQAAFTVVILAYICTVNTLTLTVIARNRQLWIIPNMYVISLAVADFLTGLTVSFHVMHFLPAVGSLLDQNKYACLFRHSLFYVMLSASIINMVLIAFDRWACITYPFEYTRLASIQRVVTLILLSWIFSIFFGTMPVYINNWKPGVRCLFFKVMNMEYQIYGQGGFFFCCSVTIAVCYGHVFRIAKTQREKLMRLTLTNNSQENDKRMDNFKRDWELVVMFSIVFGVVFLCGAPAFIYVLIAHTFGVPEMVKSFTVPLLLTNSGMNFIIYAVRNRQFRAALKTTCCCKTSTVKPINA